MNRLEEERNDLETGPLAEELRQALRPVEPPAGFADRVLARARAESPDEQRAARPKPFNAGWMQLWRTLSTWSAAPRALTAALLLCLLLIGGGAYDRQRRAVEARHQFDRSLEITRETLARGEDRARDQTRRQLEQAGVAFDAAGLIEPARPGTAHGQTR